MLDYLVREGFAIPSGTGPRGRGNPRRFTFSDLVLLKVIARLLASGIEIRRLAKALRGLKSRFDDPAALAGRAQYLLSDGTDSTLSNPAVSSPSPPIGRWHSPFSSTSAHAGRKSR
jgi:DNA-binding transcriptional MerR regulator